MSANCGRSSGTESRGGSQQPDGGPEGVPSPQALQESISSFILSSGSFTLCASLNVHNGLSGRWSLDMEGEESEGGARGSRSFCLAEQMGASATPVWPVSPIKKKKKKEKETEEASSENMSTFQLRASECWDNVVIRKWMNGWCIEPVLNPRRAE